jgi:dTMP kinase
MKTTGKLIAIDGTDGSGKATQLELLSNRLAAQGKEIFKLDFPQYGNPSAIFVEKYLRGQYGTAQEVGALRGSIFYALDRYDKSFEVWKWLGEGKIGLTNRYVSANMGHQAGKIKNPLKRWLFLGLLHWLEFKLFKIPQPTKVILLYVPPEIGQTLVDKKADRAYTQGKKRDIHEADLKHLKDAANAYRQAARRFGWDIIDCTEGGKLLSREQIHEKVWAVVSPHVA